MLMPKYILIWNVEMRNANTAQQGLLLFLPLSAFVSRTLCNTEGNSCVNHRWFNQASSAEVTRGEELEVATAGRASSQNVMTSRPGHAARGRPNKFSTRTSSHVSSVHIQQRPGRIQGNREKIENRLADQQRDVTERNQKSFVARGRSLFTVFERQFAEKWCALRGQDEESVVVVPRRSGGHRAHREGERVSFHFAGVWTVEALAIVERFKSKDARVVVSVLRLAKKNCPRELLNHMKTKSRRWLVPPSPFVSCKTLKKF